jgi:hypothetical protein
MLVNHYHFYGRELKAYKGNTFSISDFEISYQLRAYEY